jgi:hypothetical protein
MDAFVTLDAPPGGSPGLYVRRVYVPILDAYRDENGDYVVTLDGDLVDETRSTYAARHSLTSDAE